MEIKLNESVIQFVAEGIPIVGNLDNACIIGLDQSGKKLIEYIEEHNKVPQEIPESLLPLMKMLEEKEFIVPIDRRNTQESHLKSAYLHVTDHCNLHCLGCYSYIDRRNQKKELSLKAYKKIIDELLKSGVDTMVISGGEPLLREDLYLICKYAKENGITMLQVISNGTMPISKYDRIIPYIDKLTISLDGFESGVSYIRDAGIMPNIEKTINHCKKLVETTFVATLHKKNLHLQSKYDELSKKLGVEFNFSLLTVKADEIFEELLVRKDDFVKMLDQYQEAEDNSVKTEKICECTLECKKSCGAGKSMISISASGNVYPCHMLHQEELCMGNILEENLISLVNSEKNYLKNWTVEDKIQCKDCQYRYLCGGGCHARAYFENGDFCGKDSTCVVTKYGLHRYFKYIKSVYNTL